MQEGPKGRQNNGAEQDVDKEKESGEDAGDEEGGWDADAALKHADVTYLGQIVWFTFHNENDNTCTIEGEQACRNKVALHMVYVQMLSIAISSGFMFLKPIPSDKCSLSTD